MRMLARACSLAGGIGFTLLILLSLGHAPEATAEKSEVVVEDIRAVDLPELPPPPPEVETGVPLPPMPVVFEEAPSSSVVHLPPTPVPIALLAPPTPPAAQIHFNYSPGEFKPGASGWDADVRHVFQKAEVDQPIVAVYRKIPNISASLLKEVTRPSVRLLFVVNTDGSVEDVRLLRGTHPEFDRLSIEAMQEWRFRPAVRKGRKVRQLADIDFIVTPPRGNPFSTN